VSAERGGEPDIVLACAFFGAELVFEPLFLRDEPFADVGGLGDQPAFF